VKVRVTKPDEFDLQAIREMLESPAWQLVYGARLAAMKEQAIRDLVNCADWPATRFLQGSIAAIEAVMNLPTIVAQEVKNRRKTDAVEGK
jgi:uncharacterized membrane protein YhfC